MSWLRDLPVRRKLSLMILLTCAAVMLIACAALGAYELHDYRRSMARDITVLADILAKNTRAAVAFQDESTATEMLGALQSEPHVEMAVLFTREGARSGGYTRPGTVAQEHITPTSTADGHRFRVGRIAVFHPVELNERRIGTLYLQVDLEGI